MKSKPAGAIVALLLIGGSLRSTSAETAFVAFDKDGYLYQSVRALPEGMNPVEGTIRALVAGPTADETAQGVLSAIPAGTEIVAITWTADGAIVDLSPLVLQGLTGAMLNNMTEQFHITLNPYDHIKSLRLTCNETDLTAYIPRPAPVARPPLPPVLKGIKTFDTGLSGRRITIGPSHGRYWNGTNWYWMREDLCNYGEAVLEDTNSIRLMQLLLQYLTQDGATVYVHRDLNESDCCHPINNFPWWKMATISWLRYQGVPSTVWASISGNTGPDGGAGMINRSTDDLYARPLYADYVGSEIYIAHHTNAGGGGSANGTETLRSSNMLHPEHEDNSLLLAQRVQASLILTIRNVIDSSWADRGVKDYSTFVEPSTPNQPAILVELAFHDNCNRDAALLKDNFFRSVSEWAVYKGVCDYFGVTPTWSLYSCEYVSDTIPTTMVQGQSYPVSITFRNRGVVWNSARGFALGAVAGSEPLASVTRVVPAGEVKPGDLYTFQFTMQPLNAGTFTTDWRMVREGVAWFGPHATKTIEVTPASDTEPPAAPTDLTAHAVSSTKVQLNWTASTDNFIVAGYEIRRDGLVVGTCAANAYTDATVSAGGAYSYEVRAYDQVPGQYSGWSDPVSVLAPTTDAVPPIIMTHPSARTSCVDSSALFSVTAIGEGTLAYQWQKDGVNLVNGGHYSGVTTPTLLVSLIGLVDAGDYRCMVTNEHGFVISDAAVLTVDPAFALQPVNQTVCRTGTAVFTVAVTGSGTPAYFWKKNGLDIPSSGKYSGVFTDTLTVTNVDRTEVASYQCVVYTGCGSIISNTVTLALLAGASITQQPAALTVCAGQSASFTVAANSTNVTYQWQKNGGNLTEDGHYTGVTTSTLNIADTDAGDAASYRCVVTNPCNAVTNSAAASLTVKTATRVTQQPASLTITGGDDAQFTVVATGDGSVSYRWQKDGTDLGDGGHYSGVTTGSLTISGADGADAGSYQCVVTAGCGSISSDVATLTVERSAAPDFNSDGHVDSVDFDMFSGCYSGPTTPVTGDCLIADFNGDQYVDAIDFDIFSGCYNGPTNPPGC